MYEDPRAPPAEMNSRKHERDVKERMDKSAVTCQDPDPDLVVVVR